jgi:hypothetical protein
MWNAECGLEDQPSSNPHSAFSRPFNPHSAFRNPQSSRPHSAIPRSAAKMPRSFSIKFLF